MKKRDVVVGGTYYAKVSHKIVPVRLIAESPHGGWSAVNTVTGRTIHIRSAARLRGAVSTGSSGQASAGLVVTAAMGVILAIGLTVGLAFGCKEYVRYQGREDAKNDLVRAQSTRKIKVEEAIASRLSAVELAKGEVERAKGVAQANKIIADSITPAYLRYFYIQQLAEVEHLGGKIIYVPTEAGLPILEAGRLEQEPKQQP